MSQKILRLNLGCGNCPLPGYMNIDRRMTDAEQVNSPDMFSCAKCFPLAYPDEVADEIRASHILEHFGWAEVRDVLKDWFRVLKPYGCLKVAVPDFHTIALAAHDPKRFLYLMGGQTHADDFHKSCWTSETLVQALLDVGFERVVEWDVSVEPDTASHYISLARRAFKGHER